MPNPPLPAIASGATHSYKDYTSDGSTVVYSIPFTYRAPGDIVVYAADVSVAFTFLTSNTIQLAAAPASGVNIRIQRNTPYTAPVNTFNNTAPAQGAQINQNCQQDLWVAQEAADAATLTLTQTLVAEATAVAAAATATSDATAAAASQASATASAASATSSASSASSSATAAAGSATSAAGSASSATASAAAAATSATNAATSETNAAASSTSAASQATAAASSASGASVSASNAATSASGAAASATSASGSASAASTSATNAAASATSAAASSNAVAAQLPPLGIYATTAAGIAAVSSGNYFAVPSTSPTGALDIYKNNSGTAVYTSTVPSTALNLRVGDSTSDSNVAFELQTQRNGVVGQFMLDGSYTSGDGTIVIGAGGVAAGGETLNANGIFTPAVAVSTDTQRASETAVVTSSRGAVMAEFGPGLTAYYAALEGDDNAKYRSRNAANIARSAAIRGTPISNLILPPWQMTYFLADGQSESVGQEAWPAVSQTQYDGNVSIGTNDTENPSPDNIGFYPFLDNNLHPLLGNVMNANGTFFTDANTAALAPGAGNLGETLTIGFVNGIKKLRNRHAGLTSDSNHVYGANSVGISGFALSGLSKTGGHWARKTGAASRWAAIASAAAKSAGMGAALLTQGIADLADQSTAGSTAYYRGLMAQYWSDWQADIAAGTFSQADMPPLFIHCTSGGTSSLSGLAGYAELCGIANAQWQYARDNPNSVFCWGPKYMVPHKGVHLHPQGENWWGCKVAQVYDHVVHNRRQWRPLTPIGATVSGVTVAIDLLVPVPPIQAAIPNYFLPGNASQSVMQTGYGFGVYDAYGAIPIASARVVLDTIVELTLRRAPVGTAYLTAADGNNGTYTNICDSDSFVATDLYTWRSSAGMYSETNVAGLVGKPYPMNNWLVPFNLQLQ